MGSGWGLLRRLSLMLLMLNPSATICRVNQVLNCNRCQAHGITAKKLTNKPTASGIKLRPKMLRKCERRKINMKSLGKSYQNLLGIVAINAKVVQQPSVRR